MGHKSLLSESGNGLWNTSIVRKATLPDFFILYILGQDTHWEGYNSSLKDTDCFALLSF